MHIFLHILYVTNIEKPVRSGADTKEKCMDYKKEIIRMVERIENEKFLKQLYTIILNHMRRTGN